MPEPRVIRANEVDTLQRAEGVTVASHINKEFGATEISSGITSFEAGRSNTTHYHNAEESVIVIEGRGHPDDQRRGAPGSRGRRRLHHPRHTPPPHQHRRRPVPHRVVVCDGGRDADAGGGLGSQVRFQQVGGVLQPDGADELAIFVLAVVEGGEAVGDDDAVSRGQAALQRQGIGLPIVADSQRYGYSVNIVFRAIAS